MEGSGHPDSVLHGEKNRKRRERENSPWYRNGRKGLWPLVIVIGLGLLYLGYSRDNKLPRVDTAKEEARLEQVRRDMAAKDQYVADTAALEAAKPDILQAVKGMQLVKDAAWANTGRFLYVGVIDNGKSRDQLAWQACNNVLNYYQGSREVTVVVIDIAKMLAQGSFDEIGRAYCK